MSDRVVIIGASVGGIRTAQELRKLGFDGDITVVGAEAEQPYDKPPLSKQLLLGTRSESDISLLGEGGWEALGVTPRLGVRAESLDIDSMEVRLSDGDDLEYDALVIATGVRPRTLAPEFHELDSVFTVREIAHARALAERAALGPVVIIGAGFIGAEIASSFRSLGAAVTLVEALSAPFARVLGDEVGALLADLQRENGVELLTEAAVESIERHGERTSVRLTDGRTLEAATVVVGIGSIPNTEWLKGSGLKITDGVVTDAGCAVQPDGFGPHAESVFAIGDVARQIDPKTGKDYRVEHWTNAAEQAHVAARQILDPTSEPSSLPAPYFWSDQFGIKIQMVGRPGEATSVTLRRFSVKGAERTVAVFENDGAFAAAVTFGWPRALGTCRQAWEAGSTAAEVIEKLTALADQNAPAPA
ncbi:FAD-dependent oxidoreductase [Streptomyces sp. NPDC052077]|uniref:NAD(P)/FAD-dependent oxidoreductase n=1 Tax=Streptomyces sp. NPDC052077 TaxID=3154757 RepID=UPI003424968F